MTPPTMKTLILLAPLLVLAACNSQSEPEVITSNPDPMATVLANAAPVELPPAIRADKTFRCSDSSVVGVVFFQGDKQVNVRAPNDAAPVLLKAPAAGEPYTAEGGWTLTGNDTEVTVTAPGKAALTCHT
jgi:uncharacterized lipoprotein